MTIGSRQKLRTIDDAITIKINECEINRVDSVKPLEEKAICQLFKLPDLVSFKLMQVIFPLFRA